MSCTTEMKNCIGVVGELHSFFSGHARYDVLLGEQRQKGNKVNLQRVNTTRAWSAVDRATNTLIDHYSEVLSALSILAADHSSNEKTVSSAKGLTKQLRSLKFVTCLFILRQIFNILGPAIRCLQGVAVDLSITSSLLNDTANRLQTIRSDVKQQWSEVLDST
ncbi:unnamed protein product [Didymodactylos carnosus]|uniref:Uncharacterized protein n=1 Tax=Didymodactylos carnosus TaxID=1234261 RepID=A0A8S2UAJ3_9BILA|nr:unnamed protein product [Didymodactylos carnosus]CAF4324983.1 unnamed protein product [Didymodactylos carnosus]